ncbi:hypothetical protein ACUCKN_004740, partial [Salmonella enterica subsp. enterica serovar Bareilly]
QSRKAGGGRNDTRSQTQFELLRLTFIFPGHFHTSHTTTHLLFPERAVPRQEEKPDKILSAFLPLFSVLLSITVVRQSRPEI